MEQFLGQFVQEMTQLYNEGLNVNGSHINVSIGCFICDTPARALIKGINISSVHINSKHIFPIQNSNLLLGIVNHNHKHGCSKFDVVGEWSHQIKTTYYSILNNEKRTDSQFRNKSYYGTHQVSISPLMDLPIDMVQDFPVGDSLHLLDLGITKRLLVGWREGSLGNVDAKWSTYEKENISKFLVSIKSPAEIRAQRPVRDFSSFNHWKAIEFKNFGHYVGIVVLKKNLPDYIYNHFILYFCTLVIFSTNFHLKRLFVVAEKSLAIFLERFRIIYGKDYFTSNLHNLSHLIEDVKRFGPLNTFNTYPFGGKLGKVGRLLRSGNLPLAQAAKRILEQDQVINTKDRSNRCNARPHFKGIRRENIPLLDQLIPKKYESYRTAEFPKFKIDSNRYEDRWILTRSNQIVEVQCLILCDDGMQMIYGQSLKNVQDFFARPIPSSVLFIYCSKDEVKNPPQIYPVDIVKCKLFVIKRDENFVLLDDPDRNEIVFLPILSTLPE